MKPYRIDFLFLFAAFFFLFNSCENVTDPADECEKTKYQEVKKPIIYLIGTIYNKQYFESPYVSNSLDTAQYIEFTGSIQKYYCNGTPSGKFDFNTTFYPTPGDYVYSLIVGQAYQFKFENDADHLRVNLKLKVYFNHGLTYESKTLVASFNYNDVYYSPGWSSYVVDLQCSDMSWDKLP